MKVPKKPAPPIGHLPYNVNCEGGRPKEYTTEFIEAEAEAFEKWIEQPENIYFKRFALDRGYSPQRFPEFAAVSSKFAEVMNKVRQWQETKLAEGGLLDEFNAGFTKFVMGNICGWSERTETKLSGDAENPLSFILKNIDGTSKELANETED